MFFHKHTYENLQTDIPFFKNIVTFLQKHTYDFFNAPYKGLIFINPESVSHSQIIDKTPSTILFNHEI